MATFCVVLADTTVRCLGFNSDSQIGDNTTVDSKLPTPVVGSRGTVDVSLNGNGSCALSSDGTVSCWGLTFPNSTDAGAALSPIPLTGLSDVVELSQSGTCARVRSGEVYCLAYNRLGQAGDGSTNDATYPVAVNGLSNATAIASNGATSCVVLTDGALRCWGQKLRWIARVRRS